MKIQKTAGATWLPGPIYESLPYVYVIGGIMFILGTLYIGLTAPGAALYIACGIVSILYGAFIFGMRLAHRRRSPVVASADATLA